MKLLKARDLRQMTNDELHSKYNELKKQLFDSRIDKTFGKLEDTDSLKILKRNIAKILTVLRERGIKL